jgi:hypothetical protein
VTVRAGATRSRKLECCRPWEDVPATDRLLWPWQVVHQLAHSRVAFTVARLADMARIPEAEAEVLVEQAHHRKWLFHSDVPTLWVGRLPARK